MANNFRFGKLPARPDAITFKLSSFLAGTKPLYPASFGHEEYNPPIKWGMNGNDHYGVCVVAGAAHETVLLNRIVGKNIIITTTDTLEDFTAITGEAPGPDNGADMQQAASYRRQVGLRDSTNTRHRIGGYIEIAAGNVHELLTGVYLFAFAGIGFRVYSSAMDDFINHRPWGYSRNAGTFEGLHYVPCFALRGNLVTVSWARFQPMRLPFFIENCDEAVAYVSTEDLVNGRSPEGFDMAALSAKLAALPSGNV